jgi:S-(hydroxymethyl)glutathione dehydrogenase/alcohol dehydrogenase
MKTIAAVLEAVGRPLTLAELDVPELQAGQVLVEVAFSGVCHTQLLECRGLRGPDPYVPHCLGHEAGGIVLDVGAGVTKCRPGDHVALSWIKGSGANVPGCVYAWQGRRVNAGGVTTWAQHTVVSENRVTCIPEAFDLQDAALLGCAVATGVGAVWNTAAVRPGHSLVVFGAGGIGLCAIAGAVLAGANPIVAVDLSLERLATAQEMGATHTIQAVEQEPLAALADIFPAGADVAVEATGRPEVMAQALSAVRSQGGAAVVVGNAPHGERFMLDPAQLNQGKRLLGTWGGDNLPDRDFPRYCDLIAAGRLKIAPLRSRPFALGEINQALDALEQRKVARPVVDMRLDHSP